MDRKVRSTRWGVGLEGDGLVHAAINHRATEAQRKRLCG
jgi:hypothetical protein